MTSPAVEALLQKLALAQAKLRRYQTTLEHLRVQGVEAEQDVVVAQVELEAVQQALAVQVAEEKKP